MTRRRKKEEASSSEPDEYFGFLDQPAEPITTPDGWPTNVPILIAEDMTWSWTTSDGRRDLSEWLEVTFDTSPGAYTPRLDEARKILLGVITERYGEAFEVVSLFVERAQKQRHPSLAWQAACWNEMLSRLGYMVPDKARRDPGFR